MRVTQPRQQPGASPQKQGRTLRVLVSTATPDHDPTAETESPVSDVFDPGGTPELELALERVAAPELADAAAEEIANLVPAGRDDPSRRRKHGTDVGAPERPPESGRNGELEARDRAAGADDARELRQGRARIVDVAEQVGDRERVERGVLERQVLGARLDQLYRCGQVLARDREHLRALVDADDRAAVLAEQLPCDRARAGRDVENFVARACLDPRDEKPAPLRVLSERKQPGVALVGGAERGEELERAARPGRGGHGSTKASLAMPTGGRGGSAGGAGSARAAGVGRGAGPLRARLFLGPGGRTPESGGVA